MKKYFTLLRYELKTIYRDMFQVFLLLFPILLLLMSVLLFPVIFRSIGDNEAAVRYTTLIMIIMLVSFGTFLVGAMGSFLLLEHKDERTISTISVTPFGLRGYLRFKIVYIYVLAVISILIVILGTKLLAPGEYTIGGISLFDNIGLIRILAYSLVAGLFAPALALFQAAFAKNKVEGFAIMKLSGMAAMIPIIMLLETFRNGLQYLLGVFPNFWAVKAFMLELYPIGGSVDLPFYAYLGIGAVFSLLVLGLCYGVFQKKVQY